ncbi:MAG: division/cell wall cluster transcriptional repressor MraZ [Chloroflexi bacterium]|jgi:MraZ protein|nr:division/cell wall cluster transcriptional repressor MraZ [Chloroflexota bacterium]
MFLGEYTHSLDSKGRLTIPARFRAQLEDGLVIARGQDACLIIYPRHEWDALAEALGRLPRSSKGARSYTRLLFSGASEATLDKMGRVLIPAFLREFVGIREDAVLVGANSVIEIWNPEAWQQTLAENLADIEEILGAVGQMGV